MDSYGACGSAAGGCSVVTHGIPAVTIRSPAAPRHLNPPMPAVPRIPRQALIRPRNPAVPRPMDNLRLILILSLGVVLFLIYQAWLTDYGPTSPATTTTTTTTAAPMPSAGATPDIPDAPAPATPNATAAPTSQVVAGATPITVQTDLVKAEISPLGGTLQSLWLLDYAQTAKAAEPRYRLFKPEPPNMYVAQTGLLGEPGTALPTHSALFTASRTSYVLADGQDALTVELRWADAGIEVVKRYRFTRGSYVIESTQEVINHGSAPISVRDYDQLQRTEFVDPSATRFVKTYTGGVYYGPEINYKKASFEDMRKADLQQTVTDGWVAMIQHYFVGAWLPPTGTEQTFYTKVLDNGSRYIIGNYSTPVVIAPGATHTFASRLYAGPKLQEQLGNVAPGLKLTVDYGWLTILADPIFWMLDLIHSLVGNWGWAIIILTILIKAAFYKLSEASYKSMAHMRKVTPRIQALKDRYGDDKERLNQAMMELYKKEKINPLGGCLPVLVQIPVFIALYWVLLESVELRHAPFILWLDNLTEPDPYYVLPLIMGISMFVQQKLNPPPPDPIQAKVMMALPFVFGVFFAFFPSGLVLYWTVNQLLSIAQQWYITRQIEAAPAHSAAARKGD